MKNKATILLSICALAGIALGVFFLIFGLKMESEDISQSLSATIPTEEEILQGEPVLVTIQNDSTATSAATMVSKTIYICTGSIFAFVSTSVAALTAAKMAKEEEENQPK